MAKTPTMGPREFSDFCAREIEKLKFYETAKEFADSMLMRHKELEKATRERDDMLGQRDKAHAEIAEMRMAWAAESKRSREDFVAASLKAQQIADAEVDRAHAELDRTHEQIRAAMAALVTAEQQRDAFRAAAEGEMADIAERRNALRTELAALKEHFAALSR